MKSDMEHTSTSCFAAIVGRPNVGKSSLLNALVGRKVAIVSDKPQTTRTRIMGVRTDGAHQTVFLDTPGHHRPRTRLGDFMVRSIGEAVSGVDVGILVVEPTLPADGIPDIERELAERFKSEGLPAILVINKIDRLTDKSALLATIAAWQEVLAFDAVCPASALTGEGVDTLVDELRRFAVESPHFFPDDMTSDQSDEVVAAEMVREKMLRSLRDEVPHGIAVSTESIVSREGASGTVLDVSVTVLCERESHKSIIIGKRGAMLRKIGTEARTELEELFGEKINLQIWVKVKEGWRDRQGVLTGLGYTL